MGFSEDRAKGKFGSSYFLVAENPYLLWEAVEHWKSAWQPPGITGSGGTVSCHLFVAPQVDFDRLLNLGTTISLFETIQLLVIENVEKIPAPRQKHFVEILRRFGPTTKVLLTAAAIDKRTSLFKSISTLASTEEFPRIFPEHISGWVRRIAGDFDWALSPDAVELLEDVYGSDLFGIRQAIERATLYIGRQRRIEADDIEVVIAGEGEHDAYQLLEAASRWDLAEALKIMQALLSAGENSSRLLSILSGQSFTFLRVLENQNKSDGEIAHLLGGIHPFRVKKMRPVAVALGGDRLVAAIGAVFETDWAIKTSTLEPRLACELLTWRLSAKSQRRGSVWFDLESPNTRE